MYSFDAASLERRFAMPTGLGSLSWMESAQQSSKEMADVAGRVLFGGAAPTSQARARRSKSYPRAEFLELESC